MESKLHKKSNIAYRERTSNSPIANIIKNLEQIERSTHSDVNDILKKKKEETESGDEFITLKTAIHEQLGGIFGMIIKRNNMDNSPERAVLGSSIRASIKKCKKDFEKLKQIKVKGTKTEKAKKKEIREKFVEVINENILECERLEKNPYHIEDISGNYTNDVEMGVISEGVIDEKTFRRNLEMITLPESYLMNENEQELNRLLDILGNVVSVGKEIANEQNIIIDKTTQRMQSITQKADDNNSTLQQYNEHLYNVVHTKNPARHMCLQITIIIVLLGTIGVLISLFS